VTKVLDPEGAHANAARRLADFTDRRVLEVGCGDGRLTFALAKTARSWLATEPNAEYVEAARRALPASLRDRVRVEVASGDEIDALPGEFDLVFFSWSF
jgi:predicted RNA methylase